MTERVDRAIFEAHKGEVFRLAVDENAQVDITLSEVSGVGPRATGGAAEAGLSESFSILFRGPAEPVLPQSIYRLSHATVGELELFLVPIGPDGDGIAYEAVFN